MLKAFAGDVRRQALLRVRHVEIPGHNLPFQQPRLLQRAKRHPQNFHARRIPLHVKPAKHHHACGSRDGPKSSARSFSGCHSIFSDASANGSFLNMLVHAINFARPPRFAARNSSAH